MGLPDAALGAILALVATAGVARADQHRPRALSGWVMLGGAVTPRYWGAADYGPAPVVNARLQWGPQYVQVSGTLARINLLGSEHVEAGPVLNVALPRRGKEGSPVAALGDVGLAVELGAFVATAWSALLGDGDQLWLSVHAAQDLTRAHGGWRGAATAYYAWAIGDAWNVGGQLRLTVGSAAYNQTYYGVSASGAAASGLAAFDLALGPEDLSLTFNVSYALTSRWWLTAVFGGRTLVGDPAASPVVRDAGSAAGLVGGAAVSFSFW